MPVHTHESRLKILAMIFEARFEEGYRYLDHSGELLVRIRKNEPAWSVNVISQAVSRLIYEKYNLMLNVGFEKLDVSVTVPIETSQGEQKARQLGEETEKLYAITVEVLKIPRATRVGARFDFLAPSDNLEEADRFVMKALASPFSNALVDKAKGEPVDALVRYLLHDRESGKRRRIQVTSALLGQKPEDPPYLGLPGDVGSGGVAIQIDTYTRPDEGHIPNVSMFVQENYIKSQAISRELFAWLLKQQK